MREGPQYLPKFYETVRVIWPCALKPGTAQDNIFLNFSISHRCSIRRAPSVVTWAQTLNKLKLAGASTWAQIVKEWNAKVAKSNQLTGQKATAVKTADGKHTHRSLGQDLRARLEVGLGRIRRLR